ncbi:TonB-dependent receptor plug domain-containing protein [candidate division KSB1 bacterium]|nr:TonB-dependent receptor plug domain-containing protein [candidate division KSB1 bacterium]
MGNNRQFVISTYLLILLIISLQPDILFPQTKVKGIQSGLWSFGNSPYLITDDIIIPKGLTLTIEPGVIINFDGPFRIIVAGGLVAKGKSVEPIIFTSKYDPIYGLEEKSHQNYSLGYDWYGIDFIDSSDDFLSILEYCTIRYSKFGIQCHNALPLIKHIYFDEIFSSSIKINGNEIPIQQEINYSYLNETQRQNIIPIPKPVVDTTAAMLREQSEKRLLKLQKQREDSIRALNKTRPTTIESGILIFEKEELEHFGFENLSRLLTLIPGFVRVNSYWENSVISGNGISAGLFNNRILLTIDGIPFGEGLTNSFDPEMIPMNFIEKIIIYNKPRSSAPGKSAFIGQIDITTQKSGQPIALQTCSEIGSYYTKRISSSINLNKSGSNFLISTNYHENGGYERQVSSEPFANPSAINFNTDDYNFSMISKIHHITTLVNYYRKERTGLGFPLPHRIGSVRTNEGLHLGIAYSRQLGKRYSANASAHYAYSIHQWGISAQNPAETYANGYAIGSQIRLNYISKKTPASFDIQIQREGVHHLLQSGLGPAPKLFGNREIIPGTDEASFNEISTAITGGYNFSPFWGIQGSMRFVSTGTSGNNIISPSLKIVYDPLAPFYVALSYRHGHRNPSIWEQQIHLENDITSAQTLKPEKLHYIDFSMDYDPARTIKFQFSLYRQLVSDLIFPSQINSSNIYELTNSGSKYRIDGVKFHANFKPNAKLFVFFNGVFHAIIENAAREKILNYPRINANSGFGFKLKNHINGTIHLNYIGKQYEKTGGTSLPHNFLLDFSLSIELSQHLTLQLHASNLLNEKCYFMSYPTDLSTTLPGGYPRGFFFSLKSEF